MKCKVSNVDAPEDWKPVCLHQTKQRFWGRKELCEFTPSLRVLVLVAPAVVSYSAHRASSISTSWSSQPKEVSKGTSLHSSMGSNQLMYSWMASSIHSVAVYLCVCVWFSISPSTISWFQWLLCQIFPARFVCKQEAYSKTAHYWKAKHRLSTFLSLLRLHLNLSYHLHNSICLFSTWSCKYGREFIPCSGKIE